MPKIRPVEVFPVRDNQQEAVVLRDPERLAPEVIWLSPAVMAILPLFDGTNDLRDIQSAIFRAHGQIIDLEKILALVKVLDEKLFLEGETFDSFMIKELETFALAKVRPAILAGQAYAAEPDALLRQMDEYYHHPSGPGQTLAAEVHEPPRGLIAPHIDFSRGGPCYAWAYRQTPPHQPPDVAVILGTAHTRTKNLLALCRKDFATPWGPARCQPDLAGELVDRLGSNIMADEYVHKSEHSVEFQTVWLMGRFSRSEEMTFLPLLCGSFHELIIQGLTPEDCAPYEEAILVLKEALAKWAGAGKRVMVVASADLSHVGPQFGDQELVSGLVASEIEACDSALLDNVVKGDFRSLYRQVMINRDRTRVCGLASIYTLLRLLDGPQGELLKYDQWVDPSGQGLVSYAGLVFP
ncbi:MAG: AmmeMemoRadiSam system protein B [Deltaproteobacteria bacterium]|nr:AmmeMemoRadiSam system protein B [Deltaproteobacteria bacterium]